ncbi:unnamed protein product [Adineta ricciae]|uniref:Thiopurine S-methyltransferase n=1 Tax=Adineta ricciae TaxID=249248 RepID=A0A815YCE2_ADIRI|nr:unnamed protein product [Adineta ricciae]
MSEPAVPGDFLANVNSNLDYWLKAWKENRIGFHRSDVSHLFKTYLIPKLLTATEQKCIVFSLCGKSVDMMAALDAGHRVIGIEGGVAPVEAFFSENKIAYEIENDASNQCEIYKGVDRPVTIYRADFFAFNKDLPPVDYIWDRGGLVAVTPTTREQYRDCLCRMMTPGRTELFLVAIVYEDPTFSGEV